MGNYIVRLEYTSIGLWIINPVWWYILNYSLEMCLKLDIVLFFGFIDDDVTEVYHNAEFPDGWKE